MKLAFLSIYSGVVARGAETFVHELANRLVKKGHEVTVFQSGNALRGSLYKTVTIHLPVITGVKGRNIPFFSKQSHSIRVFTEKSLLQLDPQTEVVIPTNGQWQSILSKWWTIKNKSELVISGQSGLGYDDRINLFCFPKRFVALSSHGLHWARHANPFVKSIKIPNGVDTKEFSSVKPIENKRTVLAVGALTAEKQIDLTIKAVAELSHVNLVIVGEGPLQKKLQILAEKSLPGRCFFKSVEHDQMSQIYRTAHVFTLVPSRSESFGIVYLEALASGLPVVCPDDPIRREIVGNAGVYVTNPQDSREYALAIEKAMNKNWSNIPRHQALQFDWNEIATQYSNLFESFKK